MNGSFYDLLKILEENKISFCFQYQAKNDFYNLMVVDPYRKEAYFHSHKLSDIEAGLRLVWGGRLFVDKVKKVTIPLPQGFPMP
jgi:hypothetical protein